MKINSLGIKGFRSFGDKTFFNFPKNPGFFFISGKNQACPELQANGVGKSTLIEAIYWCFYGKTSENLKANDIKSWNSSEKCEVDVTFTNKYGIFLVKRTWNPNSLTFSKLNSSELTQEQVFLTKTAIIEQEKLEELIGLSADSFLFSIFFSQFSKQFLDLQPAQKTELFTTVFELDYWDELSKKANEQGQLQDMEVREKERIEQNLLGRLETLQTIDFEKRIQEWEQTKNLQLEQYESELSTLNLNKVKLVEDREKVQVSLGETISTLSHKKQEFEEFLSLEKDILEDKKKTEKAYMDAFAFLQNLKRKKQELESTKDFCSLCKQKVDISHIKEEVLKLNPQILLSQTLLDKSIEEKQDVSGAEKDITEALQEFRVFEAQSKAQISALNLQYSSLDRQVKDIDRSEETIFFHKKKLLQRVNPVLTEKQECEETIIKLIDNKKAICEEKQKALDLLDIYKFWAKTFKEVKFFFISEVLIQLEIETNNNLHALGLPDWRIEFAMDRVTQKGTISKGFNVFIYSAFNTDPVNWLSWSGGERQRLRLAAQLGLQELILAKNGLTADIEFYDEPTSFLSASGIEDLIEVLATRAKEKAKQIWLIDHRNLDANMFDGSLSIEKDVKGNSSVICNYA